MVLDSVLVDMMGLTIAQMKLAPNARKGAIWAQQRHPSIVFTSGRRDARDQARAMAQNCLKYGREWLFETYKRDRDGNPKPIIVTLYRWLEDHPEAMTAAQVTDGFYEAMLASHSGQLTALSRHLTGDAWDAQWPGDEAGEQIAKDIEANMPAEYFLEKLITKEGKHRVIHCQFAPSVEV